MALAVACRLGLIESCVSTEGCSGHPSLSKKQENKKEKRFQLTTFVEISDPYPNYPPFPN